MEKQKVQQWQLTIRRSIHTTLRKWNLTEEAESKCRIYKEYEETTNHLTFDVHFGKEW